MDNSMGQSAKRIASGRLPSAHFYPRSVKNNQVRYDTEQMWHEPRSEIFNRMLCTYIIESGKDGRSTSGPFFRIGVNSRHVEPGFVSTLIVSCRITIETALHYDPMLIRGDFLD